MILASSVGLPLRNRGFTLIEIIVVMTIIAGAIALAAPRWPSGKHSADAEAEVKHVLQRARHTAARTGNAVIVDFDRAAYTVRIANRKIAETSSTLDDSVAFAGNMIHPLPGGRHRLIFNAFGQAWGGPIQLGPNQPQMQVDQWFGRADASP